MNEPSWLLNQAFTHSVPSDLKALPPLFEGGGGGRGGRRCFSVHSLSRILSRKILMSTERPSPPLLPSPLPSIILTVTHSPNNLKSEFISEALYPAFGIFCNLVFHPLVLYPGALGWWRKHSH